MVPLPAQATPQEPAWERQRAGREYRHPEHGKQSASERATGPGVRGTAPTARSFTSGRGDNHTRSGEHEVAKKPEASANWAQARVQIDRGETGDKIAVHDPAAVPLGTDAEAGGASTPAEHIARSLHLEQHGEDAHAVAQAPLTAGRRQLVPWLVVVLVLALAVIIALLVAG
jgi:hypothetical protein